MAIDFIADDHQRSMTYSKSKSTLLKIVIIFQLRGRDKGGE